jgi:hypothetical protein
MSDIIHLLPPQKDLDFPLMKALELRRTLSGNIREHLGNQKMMKSMPGGLVYVSDFSKLAGYTGTDENRK